MQFEPNDPSLAAVLHPLCSDLVSKNAVSSLRGEITHLSEGEQHTLVVRVDGLKIAQLNWFGLVQLHSILILLERIDRCEEILLRRNGRGFLEPGRFHPLVEAFEQTFGGEDLEGLDAEGTLARVLERWADCVARGMPAEPLNSLLIGQVNNL